MKRHRYEGQAELILDVQPDPPKGIVVLQAAGWYVGLRLTPAELGDLAARILELRDDVRRLFQ